MAAIDIQNRDFWLAYVTSAQIEARKALGDPVDLSRMSETGRRRVDTFIYAPTFVDRSWNWNTYHVHQSEPAAPQTDEERRRDREKFAAVIGSIIAVVAGFFAGVVWSGYQNRSEALEKARQTQGRLNVLPYGERVLDHPRGSFIAFTAAVCDVNELTLSREQAKLRTAVSFLGSGVLLAAGGLASLPFLITAGQVALVASALYGAVQLGIHYGESDTLLERYRTLQRNTETLAGVLMPRPPAPARVSVGLSYGSSDGVQSRVSPLSAASASVGSAAPSAPPPEEVFTHGDYVQLFGNPPGGPHWVSAQTDEES